MSTFAKNTQVSVENSKLEIERTLARYGADQFLYGWRDGKAVIGFRAHDRMIRFELTLPDRKSRSITHNHHGMVRSSKLQETKYEQACRTRWRALVLIVKAKLEAVESGITSFEEEFLAHIVLPDNTTVGSWVRPQLATSYAGGNMPSLLPGSVEGA